MKQSEKRALEAYPYFPTEVNLFGHKTITADGNSCDRAKYQKGYEQAEKDLALTAEDVSCIIHLADQFGKDYQRIADVFNKDREEEK